MFFMKTRYVLLYLLGMAIIATYMLTAVAWAESDDLDSENTTRNTTENTDNYSDAGSDTAAYDFAYNTSVDYRSIRERAIQFSTTTAVNNMNSINNNNLILANIFIYNQSQQKNVAFVDKSNLTIYVGTYQGDKLEITDTFDILVGEAEGDKVREGDRKTPEGVYYTVDYLSNKYLTNRYGNQVGNIYGTGAFPINYPNIVDKIEGRGGSGIWIHGLNPEKHKPVTLGCIAMGNERFDRLMTYMNVGVTTVIGETLNFTPDRDAYLKEKTRYYNFIENFTNAWSTNNYDAYAEMFHQQFRTPAGVRRGSFLGRKKSIMDYGLSINKQTNKNITNTTNTVETTGATLAENRRIAQMLKGNKLITFNNLTVFVERDLVVYDFNQLYATNNLISYGNKRYYVKDTANELDGRNGRNGRNGLQVISEEFTPSDANTKKEAIMPYVQTFLQTWIQAWETKDVDGYTAMYSPAFRHKGTNMGLRQFAAYKQGVFQRAGNISVEYSNVTIESIAAGSVTVSFTQKYSSDTVADTGKKVLVLTGRPDLFSIRSEAWFKL